MTRTQLRPGPCLATLSGLCTVGSYCTAFFRPRRPHPQRSTPAFQGLRAGSVGASSPKATARGILQPLWCFLPANPFHAHGISYPHPVLRCHGTAGRSPSETVERCSTNERVFRYLQASDRGSQSRAQKPLSRTTFHVKPRHGYADGALQRTIKQGLQ